VLQPNAFPGTVSLNGSPAGAGTRLRAGDRVEVVAGRDRREQLAKQVVRESAGEPADPQFFLARTPGSEVIVRGARSHKLVSARFRPSGSARVERAVALTFDDGPSPIYTPRVLATLERLHVHATFFVIGYLAAEFPQLVRQEQRAGMAVGNHSYNHPEVPPFDRLPRPLVVDEISLASRALAVAGVRPRLFRPPGGSVSAVVVRTARSLGERIVLWSVDPADWQAGARARQIARNVLAAVRPGSIVILHDGGGDRSATVAALPAIVKGIRRKGLRLVAIAP
jgi:peptidoglycan/xylan/chitin deacetylase (PgdA/CDA1 family)